MRKNKCRVSGGGSTSVLRSLAVAALLATTGIAGFGTANAAPLAGISIGNQASATYSDASAIVRTATSNTVSTIVQQVAALNLVTTQTKMVAVGSPVSFAHTLTNTGNGTDTITLSAVNTAGTAGLAAPSYYTADCSTGTIAATAITSLVVAPGASVCFVANSSVSGTAANGSTGNFVLTATSGFNAAITASNTDTVTVTQNAVVAVSKSMTYNAGTGEITYTLTYTNSGNSAAGSLILADVIPTGMSYVAGSGVWSGSGTALTDAAAGDPAGIAFDENITTAGAITAVITSVAPGASGSVSFKTTVTPGLPPQSINNTGRFCYNDVAPAAGTQIPATCTAGNATTIGNPTNTVPFVVGQTAAVVATDALSTTDTPVATNDIVIVASALQGASVLFDNVINNTGTGVDTFNIALTPHGTTPFPTGTTFLLLKSDGVTPLVDTNGDGKPDTGTIAVNGSYHVFVKAILPAAIATGPFNEILTATSVFDSTKSDTVTDQLGAITTSTVDLTNNAAVATATAGQGLGAGPEATARVTNTMVPGATSTFTLFVNNTVGAADTYDLTVGTAVGPFTAGIPAGWSVNFLADGGAGNCSTLGSTLTNTGVINAGANRVVCVQVTVPANAAPSPAGTSLYFRALSPTTASLDIIHDAVVVTTVRSITLTPNNAGQIFPSGSVVYRHTLTNNGNVTEQPVTLATAASASPAGYSTVLYQDVSCNGVIDVPADTVITATGTLAPGASVCLVEKVIAPASAAVGDVSTATITATPDAAAINGVSAAVATAQDVTTLIAGQVALTKLQALDATCAGTGPYSYVATNITTGAIPGACVMYKITATNMGTANVASVVVTDSTPANTVYACQGALGAQVAGTGLLLAATTVGSITAPATCTASGSTPISASVGTLAPGASAEITFGVQINP